MSNVVADAESSFIKSEPVLAAHGAAAVLGYVASELVTHGVVTATQASGLTQQVLPGAVAVLLLGLGFVVRRFVSPAAKAAESIEARADIDVKAVLDKAEAIYPSAAALVAPAVEAAYSDAGKHVAD